MTRVFVIAFALSVALAPLARAQQIDESAAGVRVRARLCALPATGAPAQASAGTIVGHDSAELVLRVREGLMRLPIARVQSLEANTRPERDLRAIGMILGVLAGPVVGVAGAAAYSDGSGVELAFVPVGLLVGGIAGYWLGKVASDDGAWRPLSLAAGQGSGC